MYHSKYKKYKERYLSLVQQQREQQMGGHVNDQQLERYYKYKAKKYRKKYKDLVGGAEHDDEPSYFKYKGKCIQANGVADGMAPPQIRRKEEIELGEDGNMINLKEGSRIKFEISLLLNTPPTGTVSDPFTIVGTVESFRSSGNQVIGIRVEVDSGDVNQQWLEVAQCEQHVEIGVHPEFISMAGNTPSWKTIKLLSQ